MTKGLICNSESPQKLYVMYFLGSKAHETVLAELGR